MMFRRKPKMSTAELMAREVERATRHRAGIRDEGRIDRAIEAAERAQIPCADCEIGEPHVCERAYWQQRSDHIQGRECADPECVCHPEMCECCGQPIGTLKPVNS